MTADSHDTSADSHYMTADSLDTPQTMITGQHHLTDLVDCMTAEHHDTTADSDNRTAPPF